MIKKYTLSLYLIVTLYSSISMARIDHGNYHDYRDSKQSVELQKMQDFHLQQAKTKAYSKQLEHAWGDLAFLLCQVPNHHEALQHMLTLTPQLHKEAEMRNFLITALQLFPEDPVLHFLYGGFLLNVGEVQDAEQHLLLAQQIEPRTVNLFLPEKSAANPQ